MKKAFSLIELVIVIVVIGILASLSIPRLKDDNRAKAMNHILTMIRYTQNLALHDSKQLRDNPKWQRRFWRFEVKNCSINNPYTKGPIFVIGSDEDMNKSISKKESAVDPVTGKYLYTICTQQSNNLNVSPNVYLGKNFGIKKLDFNGSCAQYIGFDKFGRIYSHYKNTNTPDYSGYLTSDCNITVEFQNDKPFKIIIKKETGFAYIEENPKL